MSGAEGSVVSERGEQYSGSPTPFAFFLALFFVFLILTALIVNLTLQ